MNNFLSRFLWNPAIFAILALLFFSPASGYADFPLPDEIVGNVEVVSTFDEKQIITPIEKVGFAELQHGFTNLIGNALKPVGKGGVYEGKLLKVTKTFPIYRVYTKKENLQTGRNNRFGGWWTLVPPAKGTSKLEYRRRYEICENFNPDLDRVVKCWIHPGALLLTGPGQSVDEGTCGKPESYAADTGKESLQLFLFETYKHTFGSLDERFRPTDPERYIGCPEEIRDLSFERYSEGETAL